MTSRKKKKLIYRFLGFLLPFIIASLIITSLTLSITTYTFFNKTIYQDYRNIIKGSAGEIRLFMENAQRNLDSLALFMTATKSNRWQKEMALTAFIHTNPQFVSVALFSKDGNKIAATLSQDPALSAIDEKMFNRAKAGQMGISGMMLAKGEIPVVHMAVPVLHLGEVKEILWAKLSLKAVWDILEGIKIGRTGQVYIMDLSGRYLAHREIDRVVRTPPAEKPYILEELRKANTPVEWTEEKNGVYAYNLGAYVPGLDWIIVLSQPRSEIYAYLYRNIYWAALITFLICIAAVLFGWRWIKRFLAPVQTLHRQVQVIGRGNLDQKVSVKSEDEIGDLGHAFNEMTDSLKEYIHREVETARALVHAKNLAVLGTASSKVTHEVGNFLNNTDMALAGLKREQLSEKSEKILKILENESGRVKEFIHNFLQFAKKPDLRLQKSPLDLIIKEVVAVFRPEAEKRGIRIEFNWAPEIPLVEIDAGLMSQVMNNLLKNSLEAIENSGSIRISGALENEHLRITVSDSGPGIAPDTLGHIFEPFFTTKGKMGTGLGMSIVKTIIEAHQGAIECRSAPGAGTSFLLHLPLH